jgi:predicted HAD superfamily Cof-like phosphohydrolase
MQCPNYPHEISKKNIIEYTRSVMIQLNYFCGKNIKECFDNRDKCTTYDYENKNVISDQGDALIDIDYYSRNIAGLFGINLSKKYYEKYDIEYYDSNGNLIKDDDIHFSEYVKEFTEESKNIKCPDFIQIITHDKVEFLTKMIISELDELVCTVSNSEEDKNQIMSDIFNSITLQDKNDDQIDPLINIYYLSKNLAYSHGINLSKIFHEVHNANLRKKDSLTDKYIIRESDGKVMKPSDWVGPDIDSVIQKQFEYGSWN